MSEIAIIGYGYWGKNLLRNIFDSDLWKRIHLYEIDEEKKYQAQKKYPKIIVNNSYEDILQNSNIDSIVIATPPRTHYLLSKMALQHKKNILVEKPFTTSLREAKELLLLAEDNDCRIMVDYTFLYTGAVEKIKEIIDNKELGKLLYIDSTRINLGIFQSDINVVWDLACHDLSIIKYIYDKNPESVQATGVSHSSSGLENIAYITLKYDDGVIMHLNCSWTSPVKIRKMLIAGNKKMIVYNDIEPTDKIKLYDSGFIEKISEEEKSKYLIDYRYGDIYSPKIDNAEALKKMIINFYGYTTNFDECKSNGDFCIEILRTLEAIQYSLNNNNCLVQL